MLCFPSWQKQKNKTLQTESPLSKCPLPNTQIQQNTKEPPKCRFQPSFDSTECSSVKSAFPCFLRLNNSVTVTLCFPDGYTVEDIMLYWEGDENAIQGTEKLQIPQFTLLGKIITRKEEIFYTGGSDCFLVSYLLFLWYPGKLLRTSALDLYTLHGLLYYFFLILEPSKNTLHKVPVAYSLQIRKWVWKHLAKFNTHSTGIKDSCLC